MNTLSHFHTTATNSTKWVRSDIGTPSVASITSTSRSNVVMVQVKSVIGKSGFTELSVSIDPASLSRKLAVMRMSAELDGRDVTSTAAPF